MHQLLRVQEISRFIERREGTLALLLQWHSRGSVFSMPIAGAQYENVRDSEDRQCISFWVFQEISGFIERREGTVVLLSQLHARRSAFLMPIAGARSGEVRDSEDRQCISLWVFKASLLLRDNIDNISAVD